MDKVMLSHGSGGADMNEFLKDFILPNIYADTSKNGLSEDAAVLSGSFVPVVSTDSFVLDPIFINGTNIGEIAACGSINDVLMMGAKPLFITLGLILEEGLALDELKTVLNSFGKSVKDSGVSVICGDLKVVPKQKCDKIFINTTCIGEKRVDIGTKYICEDDVVLISGDVGRHGACVLSYREGFNIDIKSDAKCLVKEVDELVKSGIKIKALRDATRGGVASVLNEFAKDIGKKIIIQENEIVVNDGVVGLCELLGYEALELANEGTFVCVVDKSHSQKALQILQKYNPNARIIGHVSDINLGIVVLENSFGSRVCVYPRGELLPRIC